MMILKRLLNSINRDERNNINDNWAKIEQTYTKIEDTADDAKIKADDAATTAETAKSTAETVENEFNRIVAEAGSNNPEVVQARGEFVNLNERLNTEIGQVTEQLAENVDEINLRGVRPEYYGAKGDANYFNEVDKKWYVDEAFTTLSNDDTEALQNAINLASVMGTFVLLTNKYAFTSLKFSGGINIKGTKQNGVVLRHIGIGVAISNGTSGNNLYMTMKDFRLDMNENTTIGIDLSGCTMYRFDNVNVFGNGSTGQAFKLGRGDALDRSGYYNTFSDCYINGYGANGNLSIGFNVVNSANSTRFYNLRTDYVDNPAYLQLNTNNNSFYGCAFENFLIGLNINARATFVAGCRFEITDASITDSTAVEINGGYYNTIIGSHFQGVTRKVIDNTSGKLNIYFNDAVTHLHEVEMNNKPLMNAKTLGLAEQSTFVSPNNGEMVYLRDGTNNGLFFRYTTALYPISFVRALPSTSKPTGAPIGTEAFDTTLGKPIWHKGSGVWADATGATV